MTPAPQPQEQQILLLHQQQIIDMAWDLIGNWDRGSHERLVAFLGQPWHEF